MKNSVVAIGGVPVSFQWDDDVSELNGIYRPFITSLSHYQASWRARKGSIPFHVKLNYDEISGLAYASHGRNKIIGHKLSGPGWEILYTSLIDPEIHRVDTWVEKKGGTGGGQPGIFFDLIVGCRLLLSFGGLVIHGLAVRWRDKAYLFPGPSGSGKSTLARLFAAHPGMEILSGDKAILRKVEGEYRVYGAPWNLPPEPVSPNGAPLGKIFFLDHAPENKIIPVTTAETFRKMLQYSFLPFREKEDFQTVASIIEDVVSKISARRFGFKPDKSAVDFWMKIEYGKVNT